MAAISIGCGRVGFDSQSGSFDSGASSWPGCIADVGVATLSTCILFRAGYVECAGQNGRGELGDGTGQHSTTFVRVLNLDDVVELRPAAWGNCAVRADRSVWCWGDGNYGRFGSPGTGYVFEPRRVAELASVQDFRTGSTSSCAVLADGRVVCMGQNDSGQLGNGTTAPSATPAAVALPDPAVQIVSSWGGHAALLTSGDVVAWGRNGVGQWLVPTEPGINDVVELSAHAPLFVVRRRDGTVWAWGENNHGQLGDNTNTPRDVPAPIMTLADARSVAGGGTHACAVLASGEVRCWGQNHLTRYKLGVAGIDDSLLPIKVPGLPPAVRVRAGQEHTCAIVEDGSVWCWGLDSNGQMGTGSAAEGRVPTQIPIVCD